MKNKKQIPKWKDKNKLEKLLYVLGLIIAFSIIILASLQIFEIFKTIDIFEILLGILMLIQAIQYWKYDRNIAIVSLIAAIILFICGIVIIFF